MNFRQFLGGCCEAVETAQRKSLLMGMAPDGEDVLACEARTVAVLDKAQEAISNLLRGAKFGAIATRASWSPDAGPTMPSWVLIAHMKSQTSPATFLIKQQGLERWWQMEPHEMPWFTLAIAGSLRAKLLTDEEFIWKTVQNADLIKTPKQAPHPQLDENGLL